MADDSLSDRRRTHEEEYFRRKDRELLEKMRQAAAAEQARRDLGAKAGMTDPDLIRELQELGFTPDTVSLLPLVPIVQVAWAEGGISPAERRLLLELARGRGIEEGSAADRQLADWLDRRPSADVFARATRLIAAMLADADADADAAPRDLSAEDLVKQCERVAASSGGMFGIGRVSAEERAALEQIAAQLKTRAR
jgi:tellurite resistance protein